MFKFIGVYKQKKIKLKATQVKVVKLKMLKSSKLPAKKQSGFTLVVVLILSGLASILVLNSLKDNVNQERLSGNFQKKINARLVSEKGVFDSIAVTSQFLKDNQGSSIADLIANIGSVSGGTQLTYGGVNYIVNLSESTAGELVLSSTGNRFEGESSLKVRLKIVPGGGGSYFSDAVVGCEGVNLSGSGQVDSYNSKDAPYDASNPGKEGDVSTIDKNGADVILGGNSPIIGDINATGNINTKSSNVDGNLHANGNITIGAGQGNDVYINYNGQQQKVRVSGNILTRGDYTQNGGYIGGHVRANGSASMAWTNYIINAGNDGLDILYGDSGVFVDTNSVAGFTHNKVYEQTQYNVFPDVAKVKDSDTTDPDYKSDDPARNCDHLGIENVVNTVDAGTSNLTAFTSAGSGKSYTIEPTKLYETVNNPISIASTADVLGSTTNVVKLDSFNLTGSDEMLIKGGDVTLFVEGDFQMAGASKITIAAGSSLTLIVKGKVNLGAGADIIALQHGLANPPKSLPAMRIFSSYSGAGDGIKLSGDFEMYAAIYAPLTNVNINGSGTLYGAVRGKEVKITGGAAIHYDAALGDGNNGTGNGASDRLAFVGWEY